MIIGEHNTILTKLSGMTKNQLEQAYERNFQKMWKARPGSQRHQYYVNRERKLHWELIVLYRKLGIYKQDPCMLEHHNTHYCRNCTGWYITKVTKVKKKLYKIKVVSVVGKGHKCKMK